MDLACDVLQADGTSIANAANMSRNGARPRLGRRRRYDQKKAVEALRQTMLTVAMVSFIHYKWGSPMPLVFQRGGRAKFQRLGEDEGAFDRRRNGGVVLS